MKLWERRLRLVTSARALTKTASMVTNGEKKVKFTGILTLIQQGRYKLHLQTSHCRRYIICIHFRIEHYIARTVSEGGSHRSPSRKYIETIQKRIFLFSHGHRGNLIRKIPSTSSKNNFLGTSKKSSRKSSFRDGFVNSDKF